MGRCYICFYLNAKYAIWTWTTYVFIELKASRNRRYESMGPIKQRENAKGCNFFSLVFDWFSDDTTHTETWRTPRWSPFEAYPFVASAASRLELKQSSIQSKLWTSSSVSQVNFSLLFKRVLRIVIRRALSAGKARLSLQMLGEKVDAEEDFLFVWEHFSIPVLTRIPASFSLLSCNFELFILVKYFAGVFSIRQARMVAYWGPQSIVS